MPRIQHLPEDLVNKIAAGEVVERPASVVKELVENALDAGASSVSVEIEKGGKSLIRVRDDGDGMGPEDAPRALERHATSKLRTLADLEGLSTHGFRGEALPSIAGVSHLVLRTRDDSGPAGTEVEVRHGRLVHARDAGHPRGTTVEVRDLFGGVPARRKFLRSDATEAAHVAETVTLLALAHPGTGFTLTSSGRSALGAPAAPSLEARLYQIFGGAVLEDLLPVDGREGWVHVTGFVSRPDRDKASRGSVRLFVNGRSVRDRAIGKALSEAYRTAGAGDRRPEAFLFLDVPPHMLDVNVHPAKTEVRFADTRMAFAAVERAVRDALSSGARGSAPHADTGRVAEAVLAFGADARGAAPLRPAGHVPPLFESPGAGPDERRVLGQHRRTYIVATDGEDLLLVDQHTAHERVRFERLVAGMASQAVESQRLLVPLVLSLPPRLRPLLAAETESLAGLGFDVEAFGGGSVRLGAVPALLGSADPGQALEAILQDLLERESADWAVAAPRERLAATVACHSSVRAGEVLSVEGMAAIVRDLERTAHPTLCPHGRPTTVRIPREDVTRWFGRTGWARQ